MEPLRVSSTSNVNSLAGAIAKIVRENNTVDVQAMGPNSVNQAVKAIAIARNYLEKDLLDLYIQPAFRKIELQGEERTAIIFMVTSQTVINDIAMVLSDNSKANISIVSGY